MRDVVVVEAVRSPVGRRNGGLSGMHSADLLAEVQRALIDRSGIDPMEIIKEYGTDAVRFYLLREVSFGQEVGFTVAKAAEKPPA